MPSLPHLRKHAHSPTVLPTHLLPAHAKRVLSAHAYAHAPTVLPATDAPPSSTTTSSSPRHHALELLLLLDLLDLALEPHPAASHLPSNDIVPSTNPSVHVVVSILLPLTLPLSLHAGNIRLPTSAAHALTVQIIAPLSHSLPLHPTLLVLLQHPSSNASIATATRHGAATLLVVVTAVTIVMMVVTITVLVLLAVLLAVLWVLLLLLLVVMVLLVLVMLLLVVVRRGEELAHGSKRLPLACKPLLAVCIP